MPTFFPRWTLKTSGDVAPDERLPWPQTTVMGIQHVVAMFGSTALAPILMGFDPNTSVFFSGIGTLIFFLITGGRLPSYLGSSFAFIAVVIAASGYTGSGPNPNIGVALGGIVAAGVVYALIGVLVQAFGTGWIERLMPPVVTGAIVAAIGLNLAPVAVKNLSASSFDAVVGLATALAVGLVAVNGRGAIGRLPILIGAAFGYVVYIVGANVMGFGKPVDFSGIGQAAWFGLPNFTAPVFQASAMALVAPIAVILVAENLGHVKALAAMTGRDFDPLIGRAFIADGVATAVSGMGGGTGVTTYAENMGVMAVTRIYSTLVFVVAAGVALLLGFSPKFGALILTLPVPVIGGLALVVFGLIAATGGRIWVLNKVDFSSPRNLLVAGIALTAGAGDLTLHLGSFTLGGIGTATFGAILLYQVLRERRAT
ncbi:solute carrier family 23 protein [Piscinibacter gummiphilus]|uniref:Pyrimidine utilization transport protein G n=1 Tax=Piscinibacter gummiphilus TaxID=946333 RepID=A0A1W6LF15_9BURK|nr:solute carrier family 23 protein [Piscinibacter gummiphilus]ARN22855.1 pyrimidine utilization transport protein G [Piscinibacter gummiphilus]ATU67552.1 pyrimidine utilization transport protein G [Piscinibacter gummiphilus]